jgi:hypothetical protein
MGCNEIRRLTASHIKSRFSEEARKDDSTWRQPDCRHSDAHLCGGGPNMCRAADTQLSKHVIPPADYHTGAIQGARENIATFHRADQDAASCRHGALSGASHEDGGSTTNVLICLLGGVVPSSLAPLSNSNNLGLVHSTLINLTLLGIPCSTEPLRIGLEAIAAALSISA